MDKKMVIFHVTPQDWASSSPACTRADAQDCSLLSTDPFPFLPVQLTKEWTYAFKSAYTQEAPPYTEHAGASSSDMAPHV